MYALLTYQARPEYNVGDYIQSIAASRFLPRVDKYINREKLSAYHDEKVKLIMNGWFTHLAQRWPPSEKIDPLLISFHLNSQAKEQLLNEKGRSWFRKHAPVGCRDPYTLEAMQQAGVPAYFSGCLTTTLKNTFHYRTDDIYFVDVLFRVPGWGTLAGTARELLRSVRSGDFLKPSQRNRLLKKMFEDDLIKKATVLEHYHSARHSERERFAMAESFLEKYATAKLVVTSRLHCALPCLAFGTPVIFVHCGFDKEFDKCRLDGITDLFNTIWVDDNNQIRANFPISGEKISGDITLTNPTGFTAQVPALRKACQSFINTAPLPV